MPKNPSKPTPQEGRPFPDVKLGEFSAVETVQQMVQAHAEADSREPTRDHVRGQLDTALQGLSEIFPEKKIKEFRDRADLELEIEIQKRQAR
jgi:hypothetical protein